MKGNSEATKTQRHKKGMNYKPLSKREESIAKKIVDAAYTVHKILGPGLLEKVYEACFCHELSKRGLKYKRQVDIPIVYDGMTFDEGLRLDVLVEELIICELKATALKNYNIIFGVFVSLWLNYYFSLFTFYL